MFLKKTTYVFLTIVLTTMLTFFVHAFLEKRLINELLSQGLLPETDYFFGLPCYLPSITSIGLLSSGVIAGIWLGLKWWKIVYVEKRHWRFKKN